MSFEQFIFHILKKIKERRLKPGWPVTRIHGNKSDSRKSKELQVLKYVANWLGNPSSELHDAACSYGDVSSSIPSDDPTISVAMS